MKAWRLIEEDMELSFFIKWDNSYETFWKVWSSNDNTVLLNIVLFSNWL